MQGRGGIRGENWDSCNSIINKIYLKKKDTMALTECGPVPLLVSPAEPLDKEAQ